MNIYDFSLRTADGTSKELRDYAGQLLLIVNVASRCGFTPQYEGMEALQRHVPGLRQDRGQRPRRRPALQLPPRAGAR